jgi:hypothetical protein
MRALRVRRRGEDCLEHRQPGVELREPLRARERSEGLRDQNFEETAFGQRAGL